MTIVLQQEAKREIIADFGRWSSSNLERRAATAADTRAYYAHLQSNKRYLLEFRHPCPDKWQVVHSWLSDAGLLEN